MCYAWFMTMRIIMLGDIVGRVGRQAVAQLMPEIRERWQPNLVIANGENATRGSGITPDQYKKLCNAGVDGITLGDHVYKRVEITKVLQNSSNIIRPANLPEGAVGPRWMKLIPKPEDLPPVYVLTVLGRIFMTGLPTDDPFATVEAILKELPEKDPIVLLEVHAEATSEKAALAWRFNGRVAAVVGTHTHVPTADERILTAASPTAPGTAFITDMGMSGPHDSIIGRDTNSVLSFMTTAMPTPFDVAEKNIRVNGVCIDIDTTGRGAKAIERIELQADPNKPPFTAR